MKKLFALFLLLPVLAFAQVGGTTPGVGGLPQSPRFKIVTATTSVRIGTNPAASGILRIPNNNAFNARNAANSGDIALIYADGSNVVQVPSGGSGIAFGGFLTAPAATNLQLFAPSAAALQIGANGGITWQFNSASFNPTVAQDNLQSLGDPAARIKQVFAPIFDSGTTGSLSLRTNNGQLAFQVRNLGATAATFIDVIPNVAGVGPILRSNGQTNVNLILSSAGAGSVDLYTEAGNQKQVSVLDTNGATRFLTLTGSNGGNPTISTTAGSLAITPNTVLAGTLSSSKACATNYTRIGPNFCLATTSTSQAFTNAVACTNRTFTPALPADAVAAFVEIDWQLLSNNAVAQRSNTATFYNQAACSSGFAIAQANSREFVATAAGTVIGVSIDRMVVPLTGTNQVSTTQANAGGNGNAQVSGMQILGYFD